MIKAIIFDFDGVIVLSEHARFSILQRLSKRHGVEINDDLFNQITGRTTHDFFKINFPDLKQETYEDIVYDFRTEYKDKIIDHVLPIAFTNEYIRTYNGEKLLAVASGSDTQILDTLLKHLKLREKFTAVIGKEHVTRHKPDPESYIHAANKLNLSPAECVVVEDTAVGTQAAHNAGMRVYALLNGLNSRDDFDDAIIEGYISDLAQLHDALD